MGMVIETEWMQQKKAGSKMYYLKDNRTKYQKQWERDITLTIFVMLSLLFCLFYFSNAEARSAPLIDSVRMEAQWKCPKCGYRNWAQNGDWQGNYYCLRCGAKK